MIGSMQPGAINMTVVQTVLNHHFRAGVIVLMGGVSSEMFYAFLAVAAGSLLPAQQNIIRYLDIIFIPLLLVLSAISFLQRNRPLVKPNTLLVAKKQYANHFLKGFLLGIANPQLAVFWLSAYIYINNYPFLRIENLFHQIIFVVGGVGGAFCLLYVVARFTQIQKERIFDRLNKMRINLYMSIIFMVLAVLQLIKVGSSYF
jgi:threonine/homoserine/homoserine lactone efflux protein